MLRARKLAYGCRDLNKKRNLTQYRGKLATLLPCFQTRPGGDKPPRTSRLWSATA